MLVRIGIPDGWASRPSVRCSELTGARDPRFRAPTTSSQAGDFEQGRLIVSRETWSSTVQLHYYRVLGRPVTWGLITGGRSGPGIEPRPAQLREVLAAS
jgi:hypothetical protein